MKKEILMKAKSVIKVVLIGSLFTCIISVLISITISAEERLTKHNTTEHIATIAYVETNDPEKAENAVIITREYGELFIWDPSLIDDINAFNNLKPGNTIYFRMNSAESLSLLNTIVSLKTADEDIITLSSYNDFWEQTYQKLAITGVLVGIVSLVVSVICILLLTKIKKLNRMKTDLIRNDESDSLKTTDKHEININNHDSDTADTIFENQFFYTAEFYRELYRYYYIKDSRMRFRKILIIILITVAIIVDVLWKQKVIIINLNFIAIIVAIFYFKIIFPKKNPQYDQDLEINQGKPIKAILKVKDNDINLWSDNSINTIVVPFADITKAVQTKNYYILYKKSQSGIILKKDGFVKGAAIQFEDFIRKKGLMI